MEHQLFHSIVAALRSISKVCKPARRRFGDEDIVKVYYWAVIHDRPVSWACQRCNWPCHERQRRLPSPPTMSRGLRRKSVRALFDALEQRVVAPQRPGLLWFIDGKPLPISGCSKDRQAGYGRAANCKAKGYKIHDLISIDGAIATWRLAPMNKDERVMAERMLATAPIQGYVVGDSNYDSNKVHKVCDTRGDVQLVTRRRYGKNRSLGHRKQTLGRLRSILLVESPRPDSFGAYLLHERDTIERCFAHLTNWGGSLTCLPPWVRTHRRVHRWVQAKLVLTALRPSSQIRSYVA